MRPGNVSDFQRLQPVAFIGMEITLEAEQWLVDMANLLKTVRILEEDIVKVVKIQLTDIAWTW